MDEELKKSCVDVVSSYKSKREEELEEKLFTAFESYIQISERNERLQIQYKKLLRSTKQPIFSVEDTEH